MSSYIKPFYWDYSDRDFDQGKHFCITVYGHNQNNDVVSLQVTNYEPWIHMVLPEGIDESNGGRIAAEIYATLRQKLYGEGDDDHRPTGYEISLRLPLYYYSKTRRIVLKMHFKTQDAARHCQNLMKWPVNTINFGPIKVLVTATKISHLVKFHADLQIKPTMWMSYNALKPDRLLTTCQIEHMASWKTIKMCDDELAAELGATHPSYLVFDGEMYAHREGAFPDELNARDACFMLGVLHCYWNKERSEYDVDEYCLVYHPKTRYEDVGDVQNCKLNQLGDQEYEVLSREGHIKQMWFDDEIDMIDAFEKLVADLDPDGVIGHNSNSFDFKYLKVRKARLAEPFRNLSRQRNWNQNYKNIEWKSSAYGNINLWVPDGAGRLYFDTMQMAKRDYKEDSYSLDALCQNYMKIGKHKWSPQDMFAAFASGNPEDIKSTIVYCMRDVWCTWGLFNHLNLWLSYSGQSSIMGVGIFELFSRGQGIRTRTMMFKECYDNGYFMHSPDREQRSIAGGFVPEPKPGLHEFVFLIDFAGLYPSIMRRYNISNDTYDKDGLAADEDCYIFEWEDQHGKWKTRFVKPHIRKGLVPKTLEKLTDARNEAKAKMKRCKAEGDMRGFMVYNVEQLADKVSANSVYGGLAQKGGLLGLEEAGATVTAVGRKKLQTAAKWSEEKGFKVVYGDTDSVMLVKIGGLTEEQKLNILEYGQQIVDEMNADCFVEPIKMELDGVFRTMLPCSKKMYTFINIDPERPLEINRKLWKSKGLPTSRRDTCLMMRGLYRETAVSVTAMDPPDECIMRVANELQRLMNGELDLEELVTILKLGDHYVNQNYPLAIYQRHLFKLGRNVKPGDRLPFVYVDRQHRYQGECFEHPDIFQAANEKEPGSMKINRLMYLRSQFANKLDNILHAAYPRMIPKPFLAEIPNILGMKADAEILPIMIASMQAHIEKPSKCECHAFLFDDN